MNCSWTAESANKLFCQIKINSYRIYGKGPTMSIWTFSNTCFGVSVIHIGCLVLVE
ncbi:uncharacterized protein LOC143377891 isoform X2 [Andrena cerasifolii]|uniref:uncharacterized protein LOC143377891 isoform X2 n=1 Tax=Andrena cerasifolii TaxID=2819439 RepID=UPI004037D31B